MAIGTPHSKPRRIAVCIDDFGLHDGVNGAALALADTGRLSAISCMVGAPRWRPSAAQLNRLPRGQVDLGLHLDLTEYPLLASSRRPLPVLIGLAAASLLDRTALREEIDAQLDAFEQGLGRGPDHVDGHQHVHQFAGIRDVLLQALEARYPTHRPWLRRTRRPAALPPAGIKPWVIERLGCEALSASARAGGFGQNGHLLGVYDFQGDAERYRGLLAQWLGAAQDGDVLMCHASLPADAPDAILAARRNEYQVLAGAPFADLLAREGVEVAPLSRILTSV